VNKAHNEVPLEEFQLYIMIFLNLDLICFDFLFLLS
jgi:hypothetical protein